MTRPRLLDLFCGAGGAGEGYRRAGFEVVGVDCEPQPDYPCEFVLADAMTFPLDGFDAIHASPPCQAYSTLAVMPTAGEHPKLLAPVIARLREHGCPWVVENVDGARDDFPLDVYRFRLCGTSFGLRVQRHRWFATSAFVPALSCQHGDSRDLVGVYGSSDGAHGPGFKHPGIRRGPRQATTEEAREVMGMPWATKRKGLTNAIPPAYTEHIGAYLIAEIRAAA